LDLGQGLEKTPSKKVIKARTREARLASSSPVNAVSDLQERRSFLSNVKGKGGNHGEKIEHRGTS